MVGTVTSIVMSRVVCFPGKPEFRTHLGPLSPPRPPLGALLQHLQRDQNHPRPSLRHPVSSSYRLVELGQLKPETGGGFRFRVSLKQIH